MTKAFELVNHYMFEDCWDRRGPKYGNEGMMTIRWAHQNVDKWLKDLNPEVALIMFGTNDLSGLDVKEYEAKTRRVVQKCLDNGTVVILSTAPPRHGLAEKAEVFAEAVRKIARELKVPLTDYHREILKRRPGDWDGAMEKFSQYQGYDVPTLISRDGGHPSNPRKYANDYSAEGLRNNGYGASISTSRSPPMGSRSRNRAAFFVSKPPQIAGEGAFETKNAAPRLEAIHSTCGIVR